MRRGYNNNNNGNNTMNANSWFSSNTKDENNNKAVETDEDAQVAEEDLDKLDPAAFDS